MPFVNPIKSSPQKPNWLDRWSAGPSPGSNYDFIDGLRGLAILMVVAGHLFYINPKSGAVVQWVGGLIGVGGHGVTLFFALSGFLISWPFWRLKASGSVQCCPSGYGWRRFWKIYPPLALSLLLLTPVYVFLRHDPSYLSIACQWLFGLPFFCPVSNQLNPVMWTLVIEVQFYLVLPGLFFCLRGASLKTCLWLLPAALLVIPVSLRWLTGAAATFQPEINSHFPSALDSFCAGVWVAGLEHSGRLGKNRARFGCVGVALWAAAMGAFAWLNVHPEKQSAMLLESVGGLAKAGAGCLLFFIVTPQHPMVRFLCLPWLRWCGFVSYEWYLFHQPLIVWAREGFGPAGGNPFRYAAIVGGSLLLGLLLAALVYRFFSLPILKYGRARNRPRHEPQSRDRGVKSSA